MLDVVPAFSRLGDENAFAVLARATELQRQGRDIVNLGIGQPDFKTAPHIVEAAVKALRDGEHGESVLIAEAREGGNDIEHGRPPSKLTRSRPADPHATREASRVPSPRKRGEG